MEKIKSFTVNHLILKPGIYESRQDMVGLVPVITYDIRLTQPNVEPVLSTGVIHTIEHLGATFLRNHPVHKDKIVYFGPMGCRTGFYLIVQTQLDHEVLFDLIRSTFAFTAAFEGEIPGASARDCGNYLDNDLEGAKKAAARYLKVLDDLTDHSFAYLEN